GPMLKRHTESISKKDAKTLTDEPRAPHPIQMNLSHKLNRRKRNAQRGNTMLELALILTPMFALLLSIVELSMPIFKKSTFQDAVREGVRYGITYQTTYNGTAYTSQTAAIQ